MRFYLLLLGVLANIVLSAQAQQFSYTVFFDTEQHVLTAEARTELNKALDDLKYADTYQIQIQAFTDNQGENSYNYKLAQRRAVSVLDYLSTLGLQTKTSRLESFGEDSPVSDNNSPESRQKNRRVDVVIKAQFVNSIDAFVGKLGEGRTQHYTIDPTQANRIFAQKGTLVLLPANSFVLPNGQAVSAKEITLSIEEDYSLSDMLLAGLTTSSGSKPLVTAGMVNIKAIAQGQELKLAPGVEMGLGMPIQGGNFDKEMELFLGGKDPHGGSRVNWQATRRRAAPVPKELRLPNNRPRQPREFDFVNAQMAELPKQPSLPKNAKPNYPRLPNREKTTVGKTFLEEIFMSKAAEEVKKDELYAERMENYPKRVARYQKDSTEYVKVWEAYRKDSLAYADFKRNAQQRYAEARVEGLKKYQEALKDFEADLAQWEKDMVDRRELYEKGYVSSGNLDQKAMNRYFFEVNSLGWINCDKFWNVPEDKKAEMAFVDNDESEETIMLVFKSLPSILPVTKNADTKQYLSAPVPKGMEVKIIAIKVDQGRSMMAVKDTKVGEKAQYDLVYEPKTLKEIQAELAKMN